MRGICLFLLLAFTGLACADAGSNIADDINNVICLFVRMVWLVTGSLMALVIIFAGVKWLVSGEDAGARASAKTFIISAFVGLTLIFTAVPVVDYLVGGVLGYEFSCGFFPELDFSGSVLNVRDDSSTEPVSKYSSVGGEEPDLYVLAAGFSEEQIGVLSVDDSSRDSDTVPFCIDVGEQGGHTSAADVEVAVYLDKEGALEREEVCRETIPLVERGGSAQIACLIDREDAALVKAKQGSLKVEVDPEDRVLEVLGGKGNNNVERSGEGPDMGLRCGSKLQVQSVGDCSGLLNAQAKCKTIDESGKDEWSDYSKEIIVAEDTEMVVFYGEWNGDRAESFTWDLSWDYSGDKDNKQMFGLYLEDLPTEAGEYRATITVKTATETCSGTIEITVPSTGEENDAGRDIPVFLSGQPERVEVGIEVQGEIPFRVSSAEGSCPHCDVRLFLLPREGDVDCSSFDLNDERWSFASGKNLDDGFVGDMSLIIPRDYRHYTSIERSYCYRIHADERVSPGSTIGVDYVIYSNIVYGVFEVAKPVFLSGQPERVEVDVWRRVEIPFRVSSAEGSCPHCDVRLFLLPREGDVDCSSFDLNDERWSFADDIKLDDGFVGDMSLIVPSGFTGAERSYCYRIHADRRIEWSSTKLGVGYSIRSNLVYGVLDVVEKEPEYDTRCMLSGFESDFFGGEGVLARPRDVLEAVVHFSDIDWHDVYFYLSGPSSDGGFWDADDARWGDMREFEIYSSIEEVTCTSSCPTFKVGAMDTLKSSRDYSVEIEIPSLVPGVYRLEVVDAVADCSLSGVFRVRGPSTTRVKGYSSLGVLVADLTAGSDCTGEGVDGSFLGEGVYPLTWGLKASGDVDYADYSASCVEEAEIDGVADGIYSVSLREAEKAVFSCTFEDLERFNDGVKARVCWCGGERCNTFDYIPEDSWDDLVDGSSGKLLADVLIVADEKTALYLVPVAVREDVPLLINRGRVREFLEDYPYKRVLSFDNTYTNGIGLESLRQVYSKSFLENYWKAAGVDRGVYYPGSNLLSEGSLVGSWYAAWNGIPFSMDEDLLKGIVGEVGIVRDVNWKDATREFLSRNRPESPIITLIDPDKENSALGVMYAAYKGGVLLFTREDECEAIVSDVWPKIRGDSGSLLSWGMGLDFENLPVLEQRGWIDKQSYNYGEYYSSELVYKKSRLIDQYLVFVNTPEEYYSSRGSVPCDTMISGNFAPSRDVPEEYKLNQGIYERFGFNMKFLFGRLPSSIVLNRGVFFDRFKKNGVWLFTVSRNMGDCFYDSLDFNAADYNPRARMYGPEVPYDYEAIKANGLDKIEGLIELRRGPLADRDMGPFVTYVDYIFNRAHAGVLPSSSERPHSAIVVNYGCSSISSYGLADGSMEDNVAAYIGSTKSVGNGPYPRCVIDGSPVGSCNYWVQHYLLYGDPTIVLDYPDVGERVMFVP